MGAGVSRQVGWSGRHWWDDGRGRRTAASERVAAVVVLAARAIGGPWAALATGAITGAVAGRLGTPILADIWNPYVPILPLAAAVTAAWAAILARWRPGLPLAVLFGTIAAQAHV